MTKLSSRSERKLFLCVLMIEDGSSVSLLRAQMSDLTTKYSILVPVLVVSRVKY